MMVLKQLIEENEIIIKMLLSHNDGSVGDSTHLVTVKTTGPNYTFSHSEGHWTE